MNCHNCGKNITDSNIVNYLLYDGNEGWTRTPGAIITICSACRSPNRSAYRLATKPNRWKLFIPVGEVFNEML